ncbi:MAG TPA: response regulator [Terriglobales bacterium]|nr:response regulator [Terriglobales bacterium]
MKTILCIDDDATGLNLRKMMLEDAGYRVLTTDSGEQGLVLLESHIIDAVLLDYRMPVMDGGEVARRIRRQWPHVSLIMLSGYPNDVPEPAIHLVNAFVTKGNAPEELLHVIESNLEGRKAGRITILNVDDNEPQRYAITRALTRAGYDVVEARNGKEALRMAWSRPGLVLLDINLPDMLGFEVCRQLKSNTITRDIPVIHISATYPGQQAANASAQSGASRFLEHPQDIRRLIEIIQEELGTESSQSPARY